MSEIQIVPIGAYVDGYGIVAAVGYSGERFYWLINRGTVSIMPAAIIEAVYERSGE